MNKKETIKNTIVIVPNSELAEIGDELRIVKSDEEFYSHFIKYDFEVVICSIVNQTNKSFGWDINLDSNISHIKQNLIDSAETAIKKVNDLTIIDLLYYIETLIIQNFYFLHLYFIASTSCTEELC